ncbi:hypothetical protein [uncultured Piscinibacter sp.]|jgi:hypothetical protein|uniref:hypothetical protein n=1 Tax=uncultured Piscinibacter sp. TaxID=1131835 RepID=UPI00260CE985|nr:hypothetical protein [uncultured Piscinibacter sp.]
MAEPKPLTPDELERLLADLDEGAYDDLLVPPGDQAAPTGKFADVKPFDVRAWAERRGIKLPSR